MPVYRVTGADFEPSEKTSFETEPLGLGVKAKSPTQTWYCLQ